MRIGSGLPEKLDIWLSLLLAALVSLSAILDSAPLLLWLLWLLQCCCGALVHWRPTLAVVLLGLSVSALAFGPHEWSGLGSYACLVVVLSLVVRGMIGTAVWATVWLAGALVFETFHLLESRAVGWLSMARWPLLFSGVWLVGFSFYSLLATRRLNQQILSLSERQTLARELHDTVTHSLSVINLRTAEAQAGHLAPECALADIEHFSRQASGELRELLATLRGKPGRTVENAASLAAVLEELRAELGRAGFRMQLRAELAAVPVGAGTLRVLRSTLQCGIKNIVRHGDPATPCELAHVVEAGMLELTLVNRIRPGGTRQAVNGGLESLRQEVRSAGGWLHHSRQGAEWVLQAGLPLVPVSAAR